LRVVVADDALLLRAGVTRVLQDAGFEVVGQADDADALMRYVRAHRPDVVVTDIRMPPTHSDEGLQAAKRIRSELPGIGVLLLSQHVEVVKSRDVV
jgi:DNA-binding NarL/FixJ family response regulator